MVDSERNAIAHPQAVDVNAQNKDGDTALDIALDYKMDNVIFGLIGAGADLKYLGRATALVAYAVNTRNLKLLSMTIENKLDLNGAVFFALKDRTSEQDLLNNIISQLLEAGAGTTRSSDYQSRTDPDLEEDQGDEDNEIYDNDALMIAARRGLTDIVSLLLSCDAPGNSQNELGQCPLLIATENGHEAIVKMLLETGKVNVDSKDQYGQTPLWWAAQNGCEAVMKLLRSSSNVRQ